MLTSRRVVVDGRVRPASIVISDGVIQDVVDPGQVPQSAQVEDLGDAVVMAGLVDAHVHVNEPGRTEWEGFDTATRAAAAGGVTTIVDMPLNSSPVTTTQEALDEKLAAAEGKLHVDCGFYGGLVPGNVDEIPKLIDAGVLGVKAFLCHSGIDEFPGVGRRELQQAMELLAEAGVPLLVHAELVDDEIPDVDDPCCYAQWSACRPQRFELEAIELLIELCADTGCPVHIVHLAASEALQMLRDARREGLPITVETCPHYLTFCTDEIPDGQPVYKCAPPIRDAENRQKLRDALIDGDIDTVGTDHSPSPPSLKHLDSGNVMDAWGGISSLQLLLPTLWTAMRQEGATPVDVARWAASNPARFLGLDDRLGEIAPGMRANLVVWQPEASFVVDAQQLEHRHPITPYDGRRLYGVVEATYLRGQKVFDGRDVREATADSRDAIVTKKDYCR